MDKIVEVLNGSDCCIVKKWRIKIEKKRIIFIIVSYRGDVVFSVTGSCEQSNGFAKGETE